MHAQYHIFIKIDRQYRQSVTCLGGTRQITYKQFYMQDNVKDTVPGMVRSLESLMKNLTKYIEEKREYFPRLYFLSNEQIIEMCGVMEDITTLERSFHKMFEGIDRVVIVY